jgi:hypothetical protein
LCRRTRNLLHEELGGLSKHVLTSTNPRRQSSWTSQGHPQSLVNISQPSQSVLFLLSKVPWYKSDLKTKEESQSILKLATLWRFLRLRTLAIEELTNHQETEAVEKIVLRRKFSVKQWNVRTSSCSMNQRWNKFETDKIGYLQSGFSVHERM